MLTREMGRIISYSLPGMWRGMKERIHERDPVKGLAQDVHSVNICHYDKHWEHDTRRKNACS